MSLVTLTTVSTTSDFVTPSQTFAFTTLSIQTLIPATPGQTITVGPPNFYTTPSYTPTFPTQTYTVVEYDVFLAGPQSNIWSSLIVDTAPMGFTNPNSFYGPGEKVFVVPCPGWRCWSDGAKAGLLIGVIVAGVLLVLLLCCLRRWHDRNVWISHGAHGANDYERWQNSHPGWGHHGRPPGVDLQTGWGLRPYATPGQAEAALRGGASGPAPTPKAEPKEDSKEAEKKGTRQKLGAWIVS